MSYNKFVKSRFLGLSAVVALMLAQGAAPAAGEPLRSAPARLTPAEASADTRELAQLLETTHPDPYTRGGGKLAFARRLDATLAAIPADGLSPTALFDLLRPFVAALGDGHTHLSPPPSAQGESADLDAPGPWLEFEAVDGRLYVARVFRPEEQRLLGGVLLSIEDVPAAELLTRVNTLSGNDNLYQSLDRLARLLNRPADLAALLRRPADSLTASGLRFGLQLPADSQPSVVTVPYASKSTLSPLDPPSALTSRLPPLDAADLAAGFLTDDGAVACLRLASMMRYREAFEEWRATGFNDNLGDYLTETAARAAHLEPAALATESIDARIARVPSASEQFARLCAEMNRRGARTLIVDLRGNQGGNSLIADILTACLYGADAVTRTDSGYQIARLSPLYFSTHRGDSLADFRQRTGNPALTLGDYDFSEENRWQRRQKTGWTPAEISSATADFTRQAAHSPAFSQLLAGPLRSGKPLWRGQVLVVTDARTYSAGFDLAVALLRQGAQLVGVPPAQAGNCFIDICPAELTHSHLEVTISFKASFLFPGDPSRGEVLHPGRELTYEQLRAMAFDPAASLRLALAEAKPPPAAPAPIP